ncbi:DNA-methyltransferase [Hyphobacterium sp.]|jgi:site-specific DNA-methyltransferase (adenine-specific)|uniref:DNA-methyltransferase n=1 Tax=Hyphobacterium sp. TaxID=2004662 RepID=UPI003BA93CA0
MTVAPGVVRDSIIAYLSDIEGAARLADIALAVERALGTQVASSSVRSYLNLNTPRLFERTDRGEYRLIKRDESNLPTPVKSRDHRKFHHERASLYLADCMDWLSNRKPNSIEAIVTDPPYGIVEYSSTEQKKLQSGQGGVWRIPPTFDGAKRAPLPRFTTLTDKDRVAIFRFFKRLGVKLNRVLVPGANVVVASNSLLFHIVASAMSDAGLEHRGAISRLTTTMRGGDRPKNAHEEFSDVSVMPRSMWEPWVVLRKPLEGRVQDNLRKWRTGGFRRISSDRPFADVIQSSPTRAIERRIAPHPSLKPQAFMRQIVRGSLPLGEGTILDPFAGCASTLAAANALGYSSIGLEIDPYYFELAQLAIPKLSKLHQSK